MNATEAFHDKLKGRLTSLEGQLDAQMREREKAAGMIEQMNAAIFQIQGAIAVVRELLTENEAPEEPMA
jgi:chromosome segregation ATPase